MIVVLNCRMYGDAIDTSVDRVSHKTRNSGVLKDPDVCKTPSAVSPYLVTLKGFLLATNIIHPTRSIFTSTSVHLIHTV